MKLNCEACYGYYFLVRAKGKNFIFKLLFFAVCPHCSTPRIAYSTLYIENRCTFSDDLGLCNISIKPTRKMCRNHEKFSWTILGKKSLDESLLAY